MFGVMLDIVSVDHCYSKPWSAHPDASNARPLRMIYMDKFPRNRTLEQSMPEPDIPLDVVGVTRKIIPSYDVVKARAIMTECEKHVSGIPDINSEDWEERINRAGWTPQQHRLFNKINKILTGDKLARLAYENNLTEPIMRRIHIDKTARRFRQALANVAWDVHLCQWLHGVLVDNLGTHTLAAYLDILQTLKAKVPHLIDRMTCLTSSSARSPALMGEALAGLIKRPWDPVLNSFAQNKMKKLPGNPLILVAPSGPTSSSTAHSKRMRYWSGQLSSLGKVIPVTMHTVNGGSGVSIAQCLEHMIVAVKTKVVELKGHFVNRPIVLMGWNIGSLVACHVALQEIVSAVVCLGFPFTGVGGSRGDADDNLLDCTTPTLFVIGQHASTCSIDDMEDLREKMKAENSLLVVGGADDQLRVARSKKKQEGVNQVMVDKTILDEVSEFLGGILSQGPMVQESVIVDLTDVDSRRRRKATDTDELDGISFTTQTPQVHHPSMSPKGMTIAKALRARALGGSSLMDTQQHYGSVTTSTSTVTAPIKVKRKYTKRKGVVKPTPTPRKRFKSTPVPPVASPVTTIQSPLSAGAAPSLPGVPELSGLLKTQPGLLPSFKILTNESTGMKTGVFSVASNPSTPAPQNTVSSPQPQATSGAFSGLEQPLVAYKLEDYKKLKAAENEVSKSTPSIEGLLRSPNFSGVEGQGITHTSLLSLARQMPYVHMTTASSVATQIHQLLSSMSRPINTQIQATPSAASSQSEILTPAQVSQSGSPLQNSVPTLMNSLTKTNVSSAAGNIKIITSSSSDTESLKINEQHVHAVQKLQFHDFPLKRDGIEVAASTIPGQSSVAHLKVTDRKADVDERLLQQLQQQQQRQSSSQGSIHITVSKTSSGLSQIMSVAGQTSGVNIGPSTSQAKFIVSASPQSGSHTPLTVSMVKPVSGHSVSQSEVETLGQVSSLLESSPITEKPQTSHYDASYVTSSPDHFRMTQVTPVNITVVTAPQKTTTKAPPSVSTTYTATPKPSLSTLASTRTRRIRTPKQYDL